MKLPLCPLLLLIGVFHNIETLRFPGFFVPEEVQTLLSLVYSRLPPTKIGSDKRFGIGFRLGRNADAQILIELGPQSETQPLSDATSGFSKRQTGNGSKTQSAVADNGNKTANSKRRRKKITSANTTKKKTKSPIESQNSTDTINKTYVPTENKIEINKENNANKNNTVNIPTKVSKSNRPDTFFESLIKLFNNYNQERQNLRNNVQTTTTVKP